MGKTKNETVTSIIRENAAIFEAVGARVSHNGREWVVRQGEKIRTFDRAFEMILILSLERTDLSPRDVEPVTEI